MSTLHSMDVIIRSADRAGGGTPSDYTVVLPPIVRETSWSRIHCQSVYMQGSVVNVDESNNTFYYTYVGVPTGISIISTSVGTPVFRATYAVAVPVGSYTASSLGKAVRTAVVEQHTSMGFVDALDISVRINTITDRFIFEVVDSPEFSGGYFSASTDTVLGAIPGRAASYFVVPNDGSTLFPFARTPNINQLLGFVNLSAAYSTVVGTTGGSYYNPFSFDATANQCIKTLPLLFLECSGVRAATTYATSEAGINPILAVVTTPAFGTFGVWEAGDPPAKLHATSTPTLSSLTIRWRDVAGKLVNFNGIDHVIVLRLHK